LNFFTTNTSEPKKALQCYYNPSGNVYEKREEEKNSGNNEDGKKK